jgi:hypothetical protein
VDGARLREQAAADMIVAHDVPGFEDGITHSGGSIMGVFTAADSASITKRSMVGSRSPVAFSGSAASSARV